jgi:hypothetical protein
MREITGFDPLQRCRGQGERNGVDEDGPCHGSRLPDFLSIVELRGSVGRNPKPRREFDRQIHNGSAAHAAQNLCVKNFV